MHAARKTTQKHTGQAEIEARAQITTCAQAWANIQDTKNTEERRKAKHRRKQASVRARKTASGSTCPSKFPNTTQQTVNHNKTKSTKNSTSNTITRYATSYYNMVQHKVTHHNTPWLMQKRQPYCTNAPICRPLQQAYRAQVPFSAVDATYPRSFIEESPRSTFHQDNAPANVGNSVGNLRPGHVPLPTSRRTRRRREGT